VQRRSSDFSLIFRWKTRLPTLLNILSTFKERTQETIISQSSTPQTVVFLLEQENLASPEAPKKLRRVSSVLTPKMMLAKKLSRNFYQAQYLNKDRWGRCMPIVQGFQDQIALNSEGQRPSNKILNLFINLSLLQERAGSFQFCLNFQEITALK
jgi:hypothetical protein